jgi:hypothetical protein
MNEQKLSKRQYMTVVESEKCDPTRGDRDPIYSVFQYFRLRFKHLKGSNRPAGYYHDSSGSYDATVNVRWLYTESNRYFAPEITFRPTEKGIKTAHKVGQAIHTLGYREETPEGLVEALKASVVEYMDDNKDGCWDDYRPLRVWGENAMETLARAAS